MRKYANWLYAPRILENKDLRKKPARKIGYKGLSAASRLLVCVLVSFVGSRMCVAGAQNPPPNSPTQAIPDSPTPESGVPATQASSQPAPSAGNEPATMRWEGMLVRAISFEGISRGRLSPVPETRAQQPGNPLKADDIRESLRQLYATGLLESVEVEGVPDQDGVDLIFRGVPRNFIGTGWVDGAKGATMKAQLERVSQLVAGTR